MRAWASTLTTTSIKNCHIAINRNIETAIETPNPIKDIRLSSKTHPIFPFPFRENVEQKKKFSAFIETPSPFVIFTEQNRKCKIGIDLHYENDLARVCFRFEWEHGLAVFGKGNIYETSGRLGIFILKPFKKALSHLINKLLIVAEPGPGWVNTLYLPYELLNRPRNKSKMTFSVRLAGGVGKDEFVNWLLFLGPSRRWQWRCMEVERDGHGKLVLNGLIV